MSQALQKVYSILSQDAKDATYKFALLKASIEVIEENYVIDRKIINGVPTYPMGKLVLKWINYYYPVFNYSKFIPQKFGETKELKRGNTIAFRREFLEVIRYYETKHGENGYTRLILDIKEGKAPAEVLPILLKLIKKLRDTIARMPMKYIGQYYSKRHYSIYNYIDQPSFNKLKAKELSEISIANSLGRFSISQDIEELFSLYGGFLIGDKSINSQWASITSKMSSNSEVAYEEVLSVFNLNPLESRDVQASREFWKRQITNSPLKCTWSNNPIRSAKALHIDHIIPYSIWKNNDLWNLVPTTETINRKKSDSIPSLSLLKATQTKNNILDYWSRISQSFSPRFQLELTKSFGNSDSDLNLESAYSRLISVCDHLIAKRGYSVFSL